MVGKWVVQFSEYDLVVGAEETVEAVKSEHGG